MSERDEMLFDLREECAALRARIAKLEAALVLAQRHLPKRYPLVHAEIKAALAQESGK